MIHYHRDMDTELRHAPQNGAGDVAMTALLPQLPPHLKLFKRVMLAPGDAIGLHTHVGESEIYLVLSGEPIVQDNGNEYPLHAGDCHCCLHGGMHGIYNATKVPAEFLAIIVTE